MDGVVFNTNARYQFDLSEDQDRGWVIDQFKQTVLWNEGDPGIHRGVKKITDITKKRVYAGDGGEAAEPPPVAWRWVFSVIITHRRYVP